MACNNCNTNHPSESCPDIFRFTLDGTYLIPRCGTTPLPPLDLEPAVQEAETDTRLQLDVVGSSLVYTSEQAERGIHSADIIPISNIASLIDLDNLKNVSYPFTTNHDLLKWDTDANAWISFTIPEGDIETPVGVDADGKLVKSGTAPDPGSADTIPLSGVIIWPGPVNAIPTGFRECNGQALSRSVYASLFAIIGTTYGAGDGSTTFNLPDMRTRTVRGYHSSDTQFDTIGETGGAKSVTLSIAQLPPHSHSGNTSANGEHSHVTPNNIFSQPGSVIGLRTAPNPLDAATYGNNGTNSAGTHSHSFTTNNTGSGQAHENLGPYITMPYIMRVI